MKRLTGMKHPLPLPLKIVGIGRYLPKRIVPSKELESRCGLPEGWCERKQGVRERRWVEDETVSFMAAEAAKEAVTNAGIQSGDIDLIINTSQAFEQAFPEGGTLVQQQLQLGDSGIPCMSVTAACLGFIVALDLCASLLAVGHYRNILVVTSETPSIGLDFSNHNVCTMMGDGAAAVVVTRTSAGETGGLHAALMETYSEAAKLSSISRNTVPNTFFNKNIAPRNFGFDFDPQSMQKTAMKYNRKFLAKLWPFSNIDAIKFVIPNQASRFALDMMKFVFPPQKIIGIIDHLGNCGAVGYPMALYEAIKKNQIKRGDMVLMTGMGAGFSIIGIVLTY